MRRRGGVERRRVVFIGVEGKSDRAFVQFLSRVCDEAGLHLHLKVTPATGGDSLKVVDHANRRLMRHPDRRTIRRRLVLLDSDRLEQDKRAGQDALAAASRGKLEVVLVTPNLEGLLVRLHEGHEARVLVANDAERQLRKLWPEYDKGTLSADLLKRRFDLSDLRRAASHDPGLRKLLAALEL